MSAIEDRKLAMMHLPVDGRWQSEAQLARATGLGDRACSVYGGLVREGCVERRVVPIFFGFVDLGEFLRCYRLPWPCRNQYRRLTHA